MGKLRFYCFVLIVALAGNAAFSQTYRDNERPAGCDAYANIPIPTTDIPNALDRSSLAKCDSEELYFGFGGHSDPVEARKCAFLQRERLDSMRDHVFGGAGLLSMIYANGRGAPRNMDLAIRFACEVDGAPAENFGRFEHLLRLKNEHWAGSDFGLCDDITSGFMEGWCAHLQERFDAAKRSSTLKGIVGRWSPQDKRAFAELEHTSKAFFETSARNEVDLSGTGRAAFEIEAEASLHEAYVDAIANFEKGRLPAYSAEDYAKADAELKSIYSKLQTKPADPYMMGTVMPEGIRTAERAWLRYREAWVMFGKVKYPNVSPVSWRTWLTLDRIKMLKNLPIE